jgi:hypothetical protein
MQTKELAAARPTLGALIANHSPKRLAEFAGLSISTVHRAAKGDHTPKTEAKLRRGFVALAMADNELAAERAKTLTTDDAVTEYAAGLVKQGWEESEARRGAFYILAMARGERATG